jgi:hypothetical protein
MIEAHRGPLDEEELEDLIDDAVDRCRWKEVGPTDTAGESPFTEPSCSPSYRGVSAVLESRGVVSEPRLGSTGRLEDATLFDEDCGVFLDDMMLILVARRLSEG